MKKWLGMAMTTTSRRKDVPILEHRDKGVHSVVVMSLSSLATGLYWGQDVELNGVSRVLASTSPDTHGEPKLRLADLDASTKVVYSVLPADTAGGAGLCAGTSFTKAKVATDFPLVCRGKERRPPRQEGGRSPPVVRGPRGRGDGVVRRPPRPHPRGKRRPPRGRGGHGHPPPPPQG